MANTRNPMCLMLTSLYLYTFLEHPLELEISVVCMNETTEDVSL